MFGQYAQIVMKHNPQLRSLIGSIPPMRAFVKFSLKYSNFYTSFLILVGTYRVFLRRSRPLIRTHYFSRHHFFHGLCLMIFFSTIDSFIWTFRPPTSQGSQEKLFRTLVLLWSFQFIPLIWQAIRGRYNNIPFITKNVECHLGLNPEDKDFHSWYSGSYEDHSNYLDPEELNDLKEEEDKSKENEDDNETED
jgi:hypothetical protein